MRLFHKLAVVTVLLVPTAARAQDAQDPYQQAPDNQPPPQQYEQAPPQQYQDSQYPPPDPNAYAQQTPQYGYMGAHPIPYDVGSGFCYQQGAHFHPYAPFDKYLFRESGGWFYFVGDASDFGYAQQLWGYRGHHPIPIGYGGGYCFIDWPHRHHYAPPYGSIYNVVSGYYVYGGPWDPWYWRWRPYYTGYYGGYYRQSYYGGVYWRSRPAPIYRAAVVVGAPGYYRPGAVVVAPGGRPVYVGAPAYRGGAAPAVPVNRVAAPAPVYRAPAPAAAYHPAAPAPATGYRGPAPAPAPAYRAPAPAPGYHAAAPAPAPAYHAPAPAYHVNTPAPAYHTPAPAYHAPAPAPARRR
jgi:hypothetical protein